MKLNITGHETTVSPELKKYIEKKMNKLCKHYKSVLEIDVVVEEGKKKTAKKIATAKATIKIAGPDIAAETEAKTIFAAVDELERKLVRQLEKDKAAHSPKESRITKGKNILKKILRLESRG
jgi:putative sigma-54 modulation protein